MRFDRKMLLCASLAVLATSFAFPALAANLLVNGGFETPGSPGNPVLGAGSDIGGWTVTGHPDNAVFYLRNDYAEPGITFPAHSGGYSVDLTGAGNTGPANGVFQSTATAIGARYNLSFWIGNEAGFGGINSVFYANPSTASLFINDAFISDYTNADETAATVNWKQFNYSFNANSTNTKIAFLNNTPFTDNYLGLDDISLTAAVPEPASWALMIAGFGLVGSAMRRRATKVSYA
jgi:Protein of unknown function (DUF642)/PEP-CTERM motif